MRDASESYSTEQKLKKLKLKIDSLVILVVTKMTTMKILMIMKTMI